MGTTLEAVASEANVSVSTASRALNGHAAISDKTVAKVQQAAERLQYQRKRSHRRLDASRCLDQAHIGIFSLGMDRSLLTIPVVASAISGAEAALSEAGATSLLAQAPNLDAVGAGLRHKSLQGVILLGAQQGDLFNQVSDVVQERLRSLPVVWLLGRPKGFKGDTVESDDYATGVAAAEYLVAQGHRRLAFLNPKPDHLLFMRREDGFVAAARRLGADVTCYCESRSNDWKLPLHPPENVEVVQGLVDRLLAAKPKPTAVFAAADSVAAFVYRAFAVRDVRVGKDISVISGNNDAALIQGLYPHLSTFDIHPYELGRLAVRQLAMRLSYPGDMPDTTVTLAPSLLEGESVAHLQ